MSGLNLFPVFMVGLLGSVHCIGMCGGIVTALSVMPLPAKRFPVAVVTTTQHSAFDNVSRTISYNLGRITSYGMAGAIAGGLANGARALSGMVELQIQGYWLANIMLIGIGFYLTGFWRGLAYLELVGHGLWRRLQSMMPALLPLDSPLKMLAAGGLWGWLPCGMVYSMLLTAMLTGSALSGAVVMLVFGLGTVPMLLTLGLCGARLKSWMQRRSVRIISGLIVISFGVAGLMRAAHGLPLDWLNNLCISRLATNGAP